MLTKKNKAVIQAAEEEEFEVETNDYVLIYEKGTSHKFYIIGAVHNDLNLSIIYGKAYTTGKRIDYQLATEKTYNKKLQSLLKDKIAKGYQLKQGKLPKELAALIPKSVATGRKPVIKKPKSKKPVFASKEHEEKFNVFEEFLKI